MAETTPRGIPTDHIKLLNNFVTTKEAREINKQTKVTKFCLTYTEADGYAIVLEETPNNPIAQTESTL